MEVENFFALTERLTVGASVTWLSSEYGDDNPEPAEPGRDLTYAPDWAAALNVSYERPLSERLAAFFNASWSYRGDQYMAYDIDIKQDDYSLLGLQVGLRTQDGRWDLRAWCDNCLDEFYATSYFKQPFYFNDNVTQLQGQFVGAPRTWGGTLRFNL